ncbi:MAG: universal stress protein [Solirubrobacterales bacterium]|nr:universal stress protein [Solirubrobacterales bacterium]
MFRNVIVGVDGRDGGRDAIALARHLIGTDGTLTLGCICRDEPDSWGASSAASETPERKRSHELLEQARAEAGVDAQLRVHRALAVGRGLHELAEALPADLLVIGSSRRGLIGRVLIGDDTRAALNGAPCAAATEPATRSTRP